MPQKESFEEKDRKYFDLGEEMLKQYGLKEKFEDIRDIWKLIFKI